MTPQAALHLVPAAAAAEFGRDLLDCLRRQPHAIAPKYFYDATGSQLFERICALPEYYLTRTELAVLERHVGEMAALIGPGAEIVEFGAGSLTKVRLLLDALDSPARFTAIDISGDHVNAALAALRGDYPGLEMEAIVDDFTRMETLPVWRVGHPRRIGFFPGSTIGNFTPEEAHRFLSTASRLLRGGGLLIGIDLVKDPALLHAAYNDAAGVTAAFNRNLLARANRELGANFDPAAFAHYAFYNPQQRRVEMHLVNQAQQEIRLLGQHFVLLPGEAIHTENSYKFTPESFAAMASYCGFAPAAQWCDPERRFAIYWLAAG
ncbi:L-histidine N(alpha)-methyltransferase [Azospira restricta]|uniref:L-histidine N(Alpha)-methyltransferase n=1 Tax=Azospira restricta TaxID=404405 RepID=A0A974PXV0_9RHOO|nr:L-histidine N(alpha)-methyltransferase [Azospira restricta]QRJ63186.1 L-histidine N(alpha)-methyltransferase [Azospira restricta]